MNDSLATLDRISAYGWSYSHVIGAGVMAYGWRKYRRRFFAWMTLTWVFQAFGGATRELFSPSGQVALRIGLRVLITACSFAAFYHGLVLVRRKSTVTIIGIDGDRMRVREGMEDRLLTIEPLPQSDPERVTVRPPRTEEE